MANNCCNYSISQTWFTVVLAMGSQETIGVLGVLMGGQYYS